MPARSPATRPALRSLVVLDPRSGLVLGLFAFSLGLLPLAALNATAGNYPKAAFAGLLSLSLLLLTARRVARRPRPRLLTFDRHALHLEPLDYPLTPAQPAETVLLADITSYQYWLRLLRWRGFAQCHLRLQLADGRVLHLADRPGTHPDDPTGTVQLDAVARRLARRKTGPPRQLPFFSTRPAQHLLWGSLAGVVSGAGLLGLGYPAGLLPLALGVGYAATYYLWHDTDELVP